MAVFNNVSALLSRAQLAWRAGMQFGGARDLYKVFGYKNNPTHLDFLAKYTRQDIAQRVIDAPVAAVWTDYPMLRLGIEGEEWPEWKEFVKSTVAFSHLRQLDIFAGLGAFAVLVVGFDDGRALSEPVNSSRPNKVIYLQPYLEGSVNITKYEEDETNPRFGKPIEYEITPGEVNLIRTSAATKLMLRNKFTVHYSRVLHVADKTLENPVFGRSRLEPVYNLLDDLLKVTGSSAETFWLTANRGMQVDVDKEMDLNEEDAEDLSTEIEEYQHQLRRVIRTRGVKINNLGSDIADPKGVFSVLLSLLSASTGIPQRVLMGAEAGQLASQQDRANWASRVAERITNTAEPVFLKPFLQLLADANVFNLPNNLVIEWPEPFKMHPLERAQTSAQMARSAVNLARTLQVQQQIKTPLISVEEARSIIGPGQRIAILRGLPQGELPPPVEEVDPGKFGLLPEQQVDTDQQSSGQTQQPDPDMKRPEETRGRNA
jgi:hypothetical protein